MENYQKSQNTQSFVLFSVLMLSVICTGCSSAARDASERRVTENVTLTYTVGGTITGVTGSVVLQNNETDNLTVSADGAFVFPAALADQSNYDVNVLTQPAGKSCSVVNGRDGSQRLAVLRFMRLHTTTTFCSLHPRQCIPGIAARDLSTVLVRLWWTDV